MNTQGNRETQDMLNGETGYPCVDVPDSSGKEEEAMKCCVAHANDGYESMPGDLSGEPYTSSPATGAMPYRNDCYNQVESCLCKSNMTMPNVPGRIDWMCLTGWLMGGWN
jgi:hypothetical protein